jgi:hypothetical protein
MEIAQTQRISVLPDVLIQELQGESVLLNVNSGRYFGLDEVGTRMWAVLTSSESIEQACETLLAEYDVEGEKLRQDVMELIAKLVEHGLVEVHDS